VPAPGSGLGSLLDPVLFEPNLTGMDYSGSYPLRHSDPNRLSATAGFTPPVVTSADSEDALLSLPEICLDAIQIP